MPNRQPQPFACPTRAPNRSQPREWTRNNMPGVGVHFTDEGVYFSSSIFSLSVRESASDLSGASNGCRSESANFPIAYCARQVPGALASSGVRALFWGQQRSNRKPQAPVIPRSVPGGSELPRRGMMRALPWRTFMKKAFEVPVLVGSPRQKPRRVWEGLTPRRDAWWLSCAHRGWLEPIFRWLTTSRRFRRPRKGRNRTLSNHRTLWVRARGWLGG